MDRLEAMSTFLAVVEAGSLSGWMRDDRVVPEAAVIFVVRHNREVFTGARQDRYRRQTRRSAEIIDSAELDPHRKSGAIDSPTGYQ
jgi:hypothetical protein